MVQCSAVSNIYRVITTGTVNMELIKLEGNDFGGGERGNRGNNGASEQNSHLS